jgi:outer membrane murein-binding lipoprotein Lpp
MSATKYLAALCVVFTMAASAAAQEQPRRGGDRGDRGDRGGDGGDRMAEFRQRMSERTKEQLGATDAEWQVLQPKVEKVQQLQLAAASRGIGMMFGGGRGGPGGGDGGRDGGTRSSDPNASPVDQKTRDLRASVDNKDAKPEELKAKLAALREAKQKAKADLAKAQEELRELLTVRQEAVLVMNGMLE